MLPADSCMVCSLTSFWLCSKSHHSFKTTHPPTGIPIPPPALLLSTAPLNTLYKNQPQGMNAPEHRDFVYFVHSPNPGAMEKNWQVTVASLSLSSLPHFLFSCSPCSSPSWAVKPLKWKGCICVGSGGEQQGKWRRIRGDVDLLLRRCWQKRNLQTVSPWKDESLLMAAVHNKEAKGRWAYGLGWNGDLCGFPSIWSAEWFWRLPKKDALDSTNFPMAWVTRKEKESVDTHTGRLIMAQPASTSFFF